jgi:hypothetical protein
LNSFACPIRSAVRSPGAARKNSLRSSFIASFSSARIAVAIPDRP